MKNNKTLILSTFLSLLIVGCSNASSNQSSLSSSSSSSSTITPSRKIGFNQIGSLVAQVAEAKALGLANSKDTMRTTQAQRKTQSDINSEEQNKIVKVTETYNPATKILEDQTIEVTFQRITNTQTSELQTGSNTYVASAEKISVEKILDLAGNIVIKNVSEYEFRLVNNGVVIQNWTRTDENTLEFEFDESLNDVIIESRSYNASISFNAFEGFTYEVMNEETKVISEVVDNGLGDTNEKNGVITIDGLTQGLPYEVNYSGYVIIETITQDDVEGEIDKLLVLYQYTFVSFVPLGTSERPVREELRLDEDDVPYYDKGGYFSDSTRQSFVVDNETGLIFKIENINIQSLSGGCVSLKGNNIPFDMRITENNSLEFYSLYQNSSITNLGCIKDKFGNKFIRNNLIETYDQSTNTTFFIQPPNGRMPKNDYYLTNIGQAIKLPSPDGLGLIHQSKLIEHGGERFLNSTDNFKVLSAMIPLISNHYSLTVVDGIIRANFQSRGWYEGYHNQLVLYFDSVNQSMVSSFNLQHYPKIQPDYLEDYDLLLYIHNGDLFEIQSFSEKVIHLWESDERVTYSSYDEIVYRELFLSLDDYYETFNANKLISNITVNGHNSFTKTELSGNIDYELVLTQFESSYGFSVYVKGTYVAPPPTTITLQPINR
jgi:hypothetical protein